jgi:hypothetical protein
MPNPLTAADLRRLLYDSRTLQLDVSLPEEPCLCRQRYLARHPRSRGPEFGTLYGHDEPHCDSEYVFRRADGSAGVVLDCLSGGFVVEAMLKLGCGDGEVDAAFLALVDEALKAEVAQT